MPAAPVRVALDLKDCVADDCTLAALGVAEAKLQLIHSTAARRTHTKCDAINAHRIHRHTSSQSRGVPPLFCTACAARAGAHSWRPAGRAQFKYQLRLCTQRTQVHTYTRTHVHAVCFRALAHKHAVSVCSTCAARASADRARCHI